MTRRKKLLVEQLRKAGTFCYARRIFLVAAVMLVWGILPMTFFVVPLQQNDESTEKFSLRLSGGAQQSSPVMRISTLSPSTWRILYVHIGKTGGEWIKSQLSVVCQTRKNSKRKASCLERFQKKGLVPATATVVQASQETELSKQTIGYLHVNNLYPRNGHQLASHYLYSVRNPLTRLISWYIYNHPQSCDPREDNSPSCKKNAWKTSFYQCFPLLESLGWKNTSDNNPVFGGDLLRTNHCSKIFWDGWKGHVSQVKDPNHLYWNYNVSHLESGIYDR